MTSQHQLQLRQTATSLGIASEFKSCVVATQYNTHNTRLPCYTLICFVWNSLNRYYNMSTRWTYWTWTVHGVPLKPHKYLQILPMSIYDSCRVPNQHVSRSEQGTLVKLFSSDTLEETETTVVHSNMGRYRHLIPFASEELNTSLFIHKYCVHVQFCTVHVKHVTMLASHVLSPRMPPSEKQSGKQSWIPWAYFLEVVRTNEIARSR